MSYLKKIKPKALFITASILGSLTFAALQHTDLMWAIRNQGQEVVIDLLPTQSYRLQGVPGQDIHRATPVVGPKIKVAVIDTGIDVNHPDLKPYIINTPGKCEAYEQLLKCNAEKPDEALTTCRDQYLTAEANVYPADCHGWSVADGDDLPRTSNNIIGRPDFTDSDRHGTHVAGTIVSVTQNVEIIPVQVIADGPNQPIKPFSYDLSPSENIRQGYVDPANLSERVSRAIIYAINAGAQVINLSLGWPPGQNSDIVFESIIEAQRRGIIIVAAAGNDSTNALLRPCQYKGVICVAAHSPDGSMAWFTNFGYGVDIAAPGVGILSTIPTNKRSRGLPGYPYDYLTGTSQATPLVTGVIAEMLSRGIPANEVYARLILGARPIQKELPVLVGPVQQAGKPINAPSTYAKNLLSGLLDMTQSLQVKAQPLILPADKEIHVINWDRKSKNISFQFALKNFWKTLDNQKVSVQVRAKQQTAYEPAVIKAQFINDKQPVKWVSQQEKIVQVDLAIQDQKDPNLSRMPSDLFYTVSVMIDGKLQREFEIKTEVIVNWNSKMADAEILQIPVIGTPEEKMSLSLIDEVYDSRPSERDYVYAGNDLNDPQAFRLALVKYNQGRYVIGKTQSLKFDGNLDMMRVQYKIRMDIDLDGQSDYIYGIIEYLDTVLGVDGPYRNHFYIFDQDMNLKQYVKYDEPRATLPYVFYWMRVGNSMRPAWIGQGQEVQTKIDITDAWLVPIIKGEAKLKTPSGIHFYYLNEKFELVQVQSPAKGQIVDVIQPSEAQQKAGVIPVLVARNLGTEENPSYLNSFSLANIQNGKMSVETKLTSLSSQLLYRNLVDTFADRTLNLKQTHYEYGGLMWYGLENHQAQRVTLIDLEQMKIFDDLLSSQRPIFDSALSIRAGFQSQTRRGVFVLTNSEIEYHDLVSKKVASRSLERYSFFGTENFDQLQLPTTILDRSTPGEKLPALFTTSNSELARGVQFKVPIYTKSGVEPQLVSPARLHVRADRAKGGCYALEAPVYLGDQSGYSMDYFCGNKIMRMLLKY